MDIITRKEALAQGLKTYFTGKPCKHGHVARRCTVRRYCLECLSRKVATRLDATPLSKRLVTLSTAKGLGYVYAYIRSKDSATGRAGSPYYVGMSMTGERPWRSHLAGKCDLRPEDPSRVVVLRSELSRQQAFAWEAFYVERFGLVTEGGLLRNQKEGGAGGPAGVVCTPEAVQKRAQSMLVRSAEKYGLPVALWSTLTQGRKNVVRRRWLDGVRGQALLVNPPRKRGTAAQVERAIAKKIAKAKEMGIDPDEYLKLDRGWRSRVHMRHRAGWPACRLLDPVDARLAA